MSTQKRYSSKIGVLIVIAILAFGALPLGLAAASPQKIGKSSDMAPVEKPWWQDWSRDLDKNKIDDALEWHIQDQELSGEDRILVVVDYDHKPTISDRDRLASFGWDVEYVCKFIDSILVKVPISDIEQIASWKDIVMVEFAPDGQFTLSSALPSIGVPEVWRELNHDGEGVTVAIIDTGIDDEHAGLDDLDDDPDTDDPKVIAFYDSANHPNQDDGTYEPYDNHGHGTHCAGVATGTGAPSYTHIGVAPKAKLVGVKIGGGSISHTAAIRGVEWAIDNKDKFGIDILSNSWGIYIGGPANQNGQSDLSRLMDEAVEAGLVVFCAAGNTAISLTVYAPADSERAITVGSVNDDHDLSLFSSQGPTADGRIKPDVCAVGEAVRAPDANSGTGYVGMSGTSMACPMAAGLAALMLDANPDLEPDDVKQIMHETSEHNTDARFPVSPNNGYGWGVVEAFGAVKRARDMAMTFINSPPKVHEGDSIRFITNTTYTRTEYTYKGLDGMRLIGDDEIIFEISIPANWTIPAFINATSEGDMEYDVYPSVPRLENDMWVLEVEFHYSEDTTEPTEATPMVIFNSSTPDVESDNDYPLFLNITLNGMNATKVMNNIIVDNQDPPFVNIETPGNGDPVSGIVSISGSAFDPDVFDDVESVEIKINNDDWIAVNGTNNWNYNWDTIVLNNGWYMISARATDGDNYSQIHNISVKIDNFNLQPVAVIDLITPNPVNEGEEVSFSGHGEDDDGYIAEYEWKSNIEGLLSDQDTFSTSSLSVGIHDITFRVKDNDGVWSQKDSIDLRINQIPLAYIDSISPSPANEDEIVTFTGHGSDDGTIIAYNWRSNVDGVLSDLASFSTVLTKGEHEIYFRVQDEDEVWSVETMQNLRINEIPKAFIDSILPNPAREGEVVNFNGHGTDDNSIIDYEWSSSLDGFLTDISSFSNQSLSVGEHIISFRVKDDDLAWSDFATHLLTIKPVPTAFIDSISPNPADEGESVSFVGHGVDEGEIINYNWRSSKDLFLSDLASFSTSNLSSGDHMIYFSVENDNETWSEEVSLYLRINGAPTAVIDSITPNPALINEEVTFEGHGDDDLEIIAYSWYSSIDESIGDTQNFATNGLSLGDHVITFKVQDSDLTWSSEVVQNLRIHQKPTAHINSISPNPANEGAEVSFVGYGSDDGVISTYEWRSNLDDLIGMEESFSRSDLKVGEHEISFRVMDNDGVWSDQVEFDIRINQIPVAFIESISPNPANEGDTVTFMGQGDDDRSIKNYNWYSSINGFLSISDSFETSSLAVGEHIIYFSVEDDDGVWSEVKVATLRINQIPLAYIDSINPDKANQGDTIAFIGLGSDDGYVVAYSWFSSIDDFLSSDKEFELSNLSVGDHIISLSVKDDLNTWSNEVQRNLRVNEIPKAYIDSITPNPALIGETIYFVGHGVDDKEIDEYYWSSKINGYLSNSESFGWLGLSVGDHIISFKVKDQDDEWSSERYFQLKVHMRPQAIIGAILPDTPNENEILSFLGEGIDDGDITEYRWTSSIDGFLGNSDEFNYMLSAGTHIISLTVKDEEGVWSNKAIRILDVNGVPLAYIDSILPDPAEEGDVVILTGHGTDEGSIDGYEWKSNIDGVLGTESSLSITSLSAGTHNIYFKVKDDMDVWSLEASDTVVIEIRTNMAPTVTMITPANGDKVSNEIFIQAEASDEDGEIVRIEVRVDDDNWLIVSDSTYAYYYLETNDISNGEHAIYIRAYDGEDYSQEKFVIIRVEKGEGGGLFSEGEGLLVILLVAAVILIIVVIILYLLLVRRNRRSPQFIRL